MVNVGKKIQTLRLEKGLTLPELAAKAGVSKGFVFQIEDDEKTNPSLETLNKIARALDVTLAELLQKATVQAKRVIIVPEDVEPSLKEFIDERHAQGRPVDTNAIQALYVLQHRKGKSPKSKEDWRYVYESIERVFKQK
jgi:transcriptional regulator with XRE-family HTH domain